ncbi:MAG: Prophage maintenance system killer protein [Candidatus Amesbacteria bacterium GW2011_GWA2_47_11b]|uniref:Prophage maintenance system killer protein n=3 Tax=Candidatus Amesiibacteriota TaxID=1752730 RepID=A0A0G1SKM1_9BACT|nr:MAG: prophage maintenance system killer protein, death on curing protein [Microgenomates group bacterium GW2011_GWC1_46_20]KKU57917.1 MAG: Prophage maintenance system killer protein [Candidatus Amesbacteria bacterium GW2011_GWA2_47_11b]KKU70044.1 MAG: Prophage maintenance system killer protein [Candidatus Amesbacteria bacterium GW2011_GWA1_47_20]KKU83975.1 MAG: Prophage maintenance system killer protein [Candidatus Amesbacteria bacterium GW2011_GWC2_47_8]
MPKSSTNWQTVSIDQVYEIHKSIVKRAGTIASVRDFALLHSAVERPKATYMGQDLYPTLFLKAAALLQSLCLNHPFTDANKRTAWITTKRFLHVNDLHLKSNRKEAADFMVYVDNSKPEIKEISSWLKLHSNIRST